MLNNEDLSVIAPYNIVDCIYNRITMFQRGEQNELAADVIKNDYQLLDDSY